MPPVEATDKPAVFHRMDAMLDAFTSTQSGRLSGKAMFFLRRIVEESLDEAREFPPHLIEDEMMKASAVVYWVACGAIPENARPEIVDMIRAYEAKHPRAIEPDLRIIESAK